MRRRASIYKSPADLSAMVRPGLITADALAAVRDAIVPGVTTLELDTIAERVIRTAGAEPNFMLVPGYRHTVCASVNDEVVHGIPGERVIAAGDIVSIDCGAQFEGWNGDSAFTVVVPDAGGAASGGREPSNAGSGRSALMGAASARSTLSDVTEGALWSGIASLADAKELNQVGAAIEGFVEQRGTFGVIEDYVGHGIGRSMHEEPTVYNYRVRGRGPDVKPGLVVAIEPMITAGAITTDVLDDGWTVVTTDGSAAAHWEHSVAVHDGGIWVLTAHDGGAAGLAPFGVVPVPIA